MDGRLVGRQREENDASIQTDCNWTKNKNFMTRSFAVVVGGDVDMSGMQIIGWDPAAKQIRSWVFDSDGGFYEGKWTRKGDRWVIQQTGTHTGRWKGRGSQHHQTSRRQLIHMAVGPVLDRRRYLARC